jgi:E3 ubiquitin-protein ligase FANCL
LQYILSSDQSQLRNMESYESLMIKRLSQCREKNSFFTEMQDVLDRVIDVQHAQTTNPAGLKSSIFYKQLMSDIDEIGWDKVVDLNTDLSSITIMISDSGDREHKIIVDSSDKNLYKCHAQIPTQVELRSDNRISLQYIIDQHRTVFEKLQDFFVVVEDLDSNTWILEPENPTLAHCMRRIGIGNHSSIQIEINPHHPRSPPEVRFLGADSVIAPLRQNYNKNHHLWDQRSLLRGNLERTLGITFPQRKNIDQDEGDMSEKCSICYSYRLEMKVPDKVCDNAKCCRPFHSQCLAEWLRSIPKAHQSFDTIFGTCPYCSSAISVKTFNKS